MIKKAKPSRVETRNEQERNADAAEQLLQAVVEGFALLATVCARNTQHHHCEVEELVDRARARYDIDYLGSQMPPADAVKKGVVKPLTDENRRTIARWIDLGCPIDLDYDPEHPEKRGYGWMLDDNRPVLTLTEPAADENNKLTRILIGMHDYYSGLDDSSFRVTADFAIDGAAPETNFADRFEQKTQGVWEYRLKEPMSDLNAGALTVSVKDRQGNINRIVRRFAAK